MFEIVSIRMRRTASMDFSVCANCTLFDFHMFPPMKKQITTLSWEWLCCLKFAKWPAPFLNCMKDPVSVWPSVSLSMAWMAET